MRIFASHKHRARYRNADGNSYVDLMMAPDNTHPGTIAVYINRANAAPYTIGQNVTYSKNNILITGPITSIQDTPGQVDIIYFISYDGPALSKLNDGGLLYYSGTETSSAVVAAPVVSTQGNPAPVVLSTDSAPTVTSSGVTTNVTVDSPITSDNSGSYIEPVDNNLGIITPTTIAGSGTKAVTAKSNSGLLLLLGLAVAGGLVYALRK
jgi:hypothetical protein